MARGGFRRVHSISLIALVILVGVALSSCGSSSNAEKKPNRDDVKGPVFRAALLKDVRKAVSGKKIRLTDQDLNRIVLCAVNTLSSQGYKSVKKIPKAKAEETGAHCTLKVSGVKIWSQAINIGLLGKGLKLPRPTVSATARCMNNVAKNQNIQQLSAIFMNPKKHFEKCVGVGSPFLRAVLVMAIKRKNPSITSHPNAVVDCVIATLKPKYDGKFPPQAAGQAAVKKCSGAK
jgi:hypothetical protein